MFYLYIIQSEKTNRYYVGSTQDLSTRLVAHNTGSNRSTKNGRPWRIVHSEQFMTRAEAFGREQQVKSYKGGEAFKKLIGLV